MSESKTKPTSWSGHLTTVERWAIHKALEFRGLQCQRCGAGKLAFDGDPQKVLKFGRLWEAADLDQIEALTPEDLMRILGKRLPNPDDIDTLPPDPALAEPLKVTLENDLVRFLLVDVLAPRARFSAMMGVVLYLPVVEALLAHAGVARVKLRESKDEELGELDDVRVLVVHGGEHKALWEVLCTPASCSNRFDTTDGRTLTCAQATDGPRAVKDLEDWCRLVRQLGFDAALRGQEPEIDTDGSGVYELDIASARLLSTLVVARAHMLASGPRRLGRIVAELEAIKSGGGKREETNVGEAATGTAG